MTKKITLIRNNGKVTDAIVRTTSIWYYVCIRKVYEMAKSGHPLFKEAKKMVEKINDKNN